MNERPEGGERAILVHLHLQNESPADVQEFKELALSAGAEIVGSLTSSRTLPDSKYFLGSGKVEELKALVASTKALVVLFDHALSPGQERNLEKVLQCRVIDREGLILDIFAQRARSYEGKLQVEVAQLKHQSTRLIRGWTHLGRQKGGIGLRGGPGETQLEVDRRLIRKRIKLLSANLEKLRIQRSQSRQARDRSELPTVALVGYTNAGKSTLFNTLTGFDTEVANKLFVTLDPTLRSLVISPLGKVIFADTVGFVSKLPHDLIEAFRATLEEVKDADLLLHVINYSDEARDLRVQQVEEVLGEIEALDVPRIEVYNKIDLSPNPLPRVNRNADQVIQKVFISAKMGTGIEGLKEAIRQRLGKTLVRGKLFLSPEQFKLRALLYEWDAVLNETQDEETGRCHLKIALPEFRWKKVCQQDPSVDTQWESKE